MKGFFFFIDYWLVSRGIELVGDRKVIIMRSEMVFSLVFVRFGFRLFFNGIFYLDGVEMLY